MTVTSVTAAKTMAIQIPTETHEPDVSMLNFSAVDSGMSVTPFFARLRCISPFCGLEIQFCFSHMSFE
jgi:hypothetical protein